MLSMHEKFMLCYGYLFQIQREIPKTFDDISLHAFNSMFNINADSGVTYEDKRSSNCKEAISITTINNKYTLLLIMVTKLVDEYNEDLTDHGKEECFSNFQYLSDSLSFVESQFRVDRVSTVELNSDIISLTRCKVESIINNK